MAANNGQEKDQPEILVVDDTPASLQLLTGILTGHGYRVRPAADGSLALQTTAARRPDLILLDVKMPDINGYEVCRRLKADEKSCKIPVIFISALGETVEKVEGFKAGGVDYITKPFEPEEVLARVGTHLRLQELTEGLEQKVLEQTDELTAANQQLRMEVAERKQAEEKIKEYSGNLESIVEQRTRELNQALYDTETARDKIDAILKSIADGLIVTDIYNRVILMNPAAEDQLGIRFTEVINRSIDFAIQDETLRDRINTTLNKKETGYEFDFQLPGAGPKNPRIMRARTSEIADKTGKQTGIVTIIHDVTHEREVERMKNEFLSTAAHELRTPITSIQGFSELLLNRKNLQEKEQEEFISYINKQSLNLAAIVNDLLDISRLESGRSFLLNKEKCILGDAFKSLIQYVQGMSSKHTLEVNLPEKPLELLVDKEKMEQVLKNLLSNAVKYSPDGGTICLSVKKMQSTIEISIADQGIGMTPEQVEKIFEKFYRVDVSDSAVEGTGLGMTIVKYIVEAHDGKVRVESRPGKGTTVRFLIPI